MTNRIFGMISSKAAVAALLCCVSAMVTGCSTSQFLSGTDTEPMAGAALGWYMAARIPSPAPPSSCGQ